MWKTERSLVSFLLVLLTTIGISVAANAQKREKKKFVEIEVVASSQAPLQTQQRWMKLLNDVGADRVRSKSSFSGATIKVSETETSSAVRIKVLGAIQDEKLILPGKKFSFREKEAIRSYIRDLKSDGADVALAEKKAFGLTSNQLVDVNRALSKKLNRKTRGKTAQDVLASLSSQLDYPIRTDSTAKRALRRSEKILDELDGISYGTAIATIIRPLGLVMSPKYQRGEISLQIVNYRTVDEHWPVGWPSPAIPKRMVPSLFGKFPIEIRGFPLDQAINAIQAQAKVPMLFDYNTMARAEIDLAKTRVTFAKNASYAHALGKILNQTKPRMNYEIRVDEAGTAFLWITTANPVR